MSIEDEARELAAVIKNNAYHAWIEFTDELMNMHIGVGMGNRSWMFYLGDEGARFMLWFMWDAMWNVLPEGDA